MDEEEKLREISFDARIPFERRENLFNVSDVSKHIYRFWRAELSNGKALRRLFSQPFEVKRACRSRGEPGVFAFLGGNGALGDV